MLEKLAHRLTVGLVVGLDEAHHAGIAALLETPVDVQDVGEATAHPRSDVAPGAAEDDHDAAGHVLERVVAGTLDHRPRAAVANREPFAGDATYEELARRCSVEQHVAGDDIVVGLTASVVRGNDNDPSAAEALAAPVVDLAVDGDGDAAGEPRAQRLPGAALEVDADGVIGKAGGTVPQSHLAAEPSPDASIAIAHAHAQLEWAAAVERVTGERDDPLVDVAVPGVGRTGLEMARLAGRDQQAGEVDVAAGVHLAEQLDAADQVLEAAHPKA